ncbi:MAG TPA: hypothetical protein VIJ57_09020 [Hanamia sp.]
MKLNNHYQEKKNEIENGKGKFKKWKIKINDKSLFTVKVKELVLKPALCTY